MNNLMSRVMETVYDRRWYLGFTPDTTDDQARLVFTQRYKSEPEEFIHTKGGLLVGPIPDNPVVLEYGDDAINNVVWTMSDK